MSEDTTTISAQITSDGTIRRPESESQPVVDLISFSDVIQSPRLLSSAVRAITDGLNDERVRAKGINSTTPKTQEEIESFFLQAASDPNQRAFFVVDTFMATRVYGMIRAVDIHKDKDGKSTAEVIATNTNYDTWKKSAMTNALQQFTLLMNDNGIKKLWAKVDPENKAPQRVLEKAAWRKVGEKTIDGKNFLIYNQYPYTYIKERRIFWIRKP